MRLSFERKFFPYLFLAPAILLIGLVLIYPILFGIQTMFFDWNYINPLIPKKFIGLQNFSRVFSDEIFWKAISNTFIYTLVNVIVAFILGFMLALLMNQEFRGKNVIRVAMMLPILIVPVVIALLWRVLYNGQFGLIPHILQALGVIAEGETPIAMPNYALLSVIVVKMWQVTPFYFLVLYAGLQSIPIEQYQVAKIDGCGKVQEFVYITLPWVKPIIIVVLLITFIDAFKVFDLIYILTGGGPGNQTEVISYYVYRQSFNLFKVGYGSALAFIVLVIEGLVTIAFLSTVSRQK
jgi:multiple sugar transport system permease protein